MMKSRIKTSQVLELMPEYNKLYDIVSMLKNMYPHLSKKEIVSKLQYMEAYYRRLYTNVHFTFYESVGMAIRSK